jgi:hypothetical protein
MDEPIRSTRMLRAAAAPPKLRWALAGALAMLALAPPGALSPARAADPVPVQARAGLDLATAAARIWSPDAALVYLENDEPLDTHGASERWGYLFYSPALEKSRGYSVRAGKIVVAEDLPLKLEAPPVQGDWIDSGTAYRLADEGPARRYCFEHDGRLKTMLLMRGAIQEDDPNQTTWMLVYNAPNLPALFVVLAAADGRVLRTWKG